MIEVTFDPASPTGLTCHLGHLEMPPDDPNDGWPAVTFAAMEWADNILTPQTWEYVDSHPDTSAHPDLQAYRDGSTLSFRWATNPSAVADYAMNEAFLVLGFDPAYLYVLEKVS